ncbi:hypothetical protein WJX73_001175 [Symbiochloris irregularis]|uniref:SprT-like domain-containing protein n=1 Tax=Symbiochloris irregularis TaxID=706552 RepID=A0AAW1NVD9_9CHLO
MSNIPGDDLDVHELPVFELSALFMHYDDVYFGNDLSRGGVWVEWSSSRMTLCAGVCEHQAGGGARIKLSEPLLKLRPILELKETLLHEMIHAYIFIMRIRDGDHGPQFQQRMRLINQATCVDCQRPPQGYNITIYHSLHDEVDNYRTHHWKCKQCGNLVKRASNRPPQVADCRGRNGRGPDCMDVKCAYHMHIKHCGGEYEKIAEPAGFKDKNKRKKASGTGPDSQKGNAKRPNKGSTTGEPSQQASIHDLLPVPFISESPGHAPQNTSDQRRFAAVVDLT